MCVAPGVKPRAARPATHLEGERSSPPSVQDQPNNLKSSAGGSRRRRARQSAPEGGRPVRSEARGAGWAGYSPLVAQSTFHVLASNLCPSMRLQARSAADELCGERGGGAAVDGSERRPQARQTPGRQLQVRPGSGDGEPLTHAARVLGSAQLGEASASSALHTTADGGLEARGRTGRRAGCWPPPRPGAPVKLHQRAPLLDEALHLADGAPVLHFLRTGAGRVDETEG